MKKKLLIIIPVLLLGGGYEAKAKFMAPKPVKPKLAGEIYILPKQFMCNLQDGHYATLTVALELAPGQSDGATAEAGATATGATVGTLPEEAVIRAIITNLITNDTSNALVTGSGRADLETQILSQIKTQTDVKVDHVFFTDVAVQ
jgi:flagellar basal body-associated protein FliL